MATIGSLGVGSGLDLNGLLDKLAAAEQQPLTAIKTRQADYNNKLSAYGTVQSLLDSFQVAARKLADPAFMGAFKASSSAADVLGASADTTAAVGSYQVDVAQLARGQALVAGGVASTTAPIGTGAATTVTIDFGAIAGTFNATTGTYDPGATFTADTARSQVSLTIDSSNNTLAGIRDAINKAAGAAVSATIVNDGSSNRLLLTSSVTGKSSSMQIKVTGDADVQALLANDPTGVQSLRQTAAAADAALTVNGIAVTSASNTVASAIQGVTMTLAGTGSSVVEVTRDTASVKSAITDFASAYNKLQGKLKELSAYDPTKKTGAALMGDSAVRIIQSRLHSALVEPQAGEVGDPEVLSAIGVTFQLDGTLSVDAAKLDAALSGNPTGVARLFTGSGTSTGLAGSISSTIDGFNAADGLLKVATDGASKAVRRLDEDYDVMQDRIDAKLARYRAQFQQLDAMMSSMNSTSNYLAQQFGKKGD